LICGGFQVEQAPSDVPASRRIARGAARISRVPLTN
jgi:hypothetical protein